MLDFKFIQDNWMYIAGGIGDTLGVSILSILLATFLAWVVTKGRQSTLLPIRWLVNLYMVVVDGTPLLLQIFFIFLALPQIGIYLPGLWAGTLVLGINYSVHMSETFLISHVSLDEVQHTPWRSALPLVGREFIGIIKDSTLISVTGFMHDIMWRASRVGRAQFKNLEALFVAAVIYWILILIVSILFGGRAGMKLSAEPEAAVQSPGE